MTDDKDQERIDKQVVIPRGGHWFLSRIRQVTAVQIIEADWFLTL